jgi:8-oxo-dGTP pyrophosphatase MutT (NUDIX family)
MPGGAIENKRDNGITLAAGIREVFEETKLKAVYAERLFYCDFEGERANHKVCLIKTEGTVDINRAELDAYIWWDMKNDIPVQGHVKKILHDYKERTPHFLQS